MHYGFLPHMDANIKCVLFQCLPYLPMPYYAVHMCCSNQANFIASGWVDQKDPHSLFLYCLLSPFHAVICAKGRIKVASLRSQPSLLRLVKEGKLGGHACFGAEGLQDSLSGESSGLICHIFWNTTQSRGCYKKNSPVLVFPLFKTIFIWLHSGG